MPRAPRTKRQDAPAPRRTKINLTLDAELRRRLGAYAAWHGRTESDLVAAALEPLLKGFRVQQLAQAPAGDPDSALTIPCGDAEQDPASQRAA